MRSFSTLALGLTLIDLSAARVAHNAENGIERRESDSPVLNWFNRMLRKDVDNSLESRQASVPSDDDDGDCYIDAFYNFVFNTTDGEEFCRDLMNYPAVINVLDVTPTT